VPLNPLLVTDLDTALEESTVEGLRWDESSRQVDVLLRVLALGADGEVDADPRRVLSCSGASQLRVLLRRDRFVTLGYGPVIPLPDRAALEEFLASLSSRGPMYGGRAFDDPSPVDDWPATASLSVTFTADGPGQGLPGHPQARVEAAPHCLYWFADCARDEPGGTVAYRLEGLVRFTDLSVRRADGAPLDIRAFADDGVRWWAARLNDDPRVSSWARHELIELNGTE
jgi:hypothetical protein